MQARSYVPQVLVSVVVWLLATAPAHAQCGARPELQDLGFRTGPVQLSSVAPEIAGALSLLVEGGEPNQQGCVMLSPASRPTFYPPFNITFVPDLAGAFVVSYHLDAGGNCLPVYIPSVPATVCNFELFAQSIVCDTRLPAGVAATNALRVRIGSDPTLPVINAPVGFPVELGNRAAFTISATDADGSPLSVTLEPMPLLQHAAYDVASGAFAFTPDESQLGEQVFTAVATGQAGTVRRPIRVLVSARAPGGTTDLAGEVRDSQSAAPVPGIAVRIPGTSLQTTTNQYGRFVLQNIPATAAAVELDGAALNPPYAFVAEDLGLLLGHPLYQGQTNTVWRPVYLPLLGPPAGTIDPTQQSTLTNAAIGVQVVVDAGAATVGGQPFQGAVYLPEVPRNQTPAALPEEYEPALVIAVQPAGINFNPPARVTFPNRSNLPPGTETDLWSIDPVVGQFRIVGTCVVSNDGLRLETTSGGIRNSSWHFAECGGPNSDGKTKDNPCENEELECGKGGHSVVHYQTGNLQEEHRTAPYRSLGQERSLRFVYNSK
ncbi:MAG: hypothetical protein KDF65_16885, partial [Anaerolineae bacterium]|nr:hypothetical protein [Anaerolineae bacterium]